jgi:hypothetical protein
MPRSTRPILVTKPFTEPAPRRTLVLAWRVTNAAIGMGAAVASWVFAGMFAASLTLLLVLQPLFGVSPAP